MNVLLIEPDLILAKEYKKAFKQAGIDVDISHTAQRAIMMLDKQKYGAVILELQLAEHSGIEFLQEFRSYEDWALTPVFIYSSIPEYTLETDSKTWASFNVAGYFYKPKTTIKQLVDTVKVAISK